MNLDDLSIVLIDTACYITKAFKNLKLKSLVFFRVICSAHLVHNCAMKILIDVLATVKAFKIKNKTRSELFYSIKKPSEVIFT